MNKLLAFLTKHWGKILLAIVIIILVIAIMRNASRWLAALKRLTMKDGGDYSQGFTNGGDATVTGAEETARKKAIETLVEQTYAQIHAAVTNPDAREAAMGALLKLNDTELRYAAQHYKLLSRDETLYAAVDAEYMPMSGVDEQLMARLSNIAQI